MRASLPAFLARLSRTFAGFTAGQKVVSVLLVLGLALGGVFFSRWAGAPTYAPLFSSLAASDASAIVDKLNASGTPYQLADGGQTILVPKDKVYDVRLQMSGQGLPAGDSTSGYPLLDKQGLTTSEFQQQVGYQRALEGELTKTLGHLDGVDAAVVHLALPQRDVFATKDQKDPTASVLLDTAPGKDLTPDKVQGVVHLVSSSVEGMKPADVTVTDSTGKVLSAAGDLGLAAAGDTRAQQTQAYEQRKSSELQAIVDRVVGPGHAVVQVTADLDFDPRSVTSKKYTDPKVRPLSVTTKKESYKGAGAPVGGVLGPDAVGATGTVTGTTTGKGNDYKGGTTTQDNALNTTETQGQVAPGAVKRQSVAVLLDAKTAGTVNPAQLQKLLGPAAGLDTKRGDVIAVDRLPFDTTAQDQAAQELAAAKKAEARAALLRTARSAGLGVLGVLALLIGLRVSRRRSAAGDLAALESERSQLEDLRRSVALQLNEVRALEATSARPELEPGPSDAQALRREQVRGDIAELVERQPDEVAALLRGWLADRRS